MLDNEEEKQKIADNGEGDKCQKGVRTKIWTPKGLSKGALLCIHMRKNLLH